jgi:hypothetical protein
MKKLLLATTALLALSGVAKADTFTAVDYTMDPGYQAVFISPPGENVYAGQIHLIGTGGTFMDVWCLDVFDNIVKPYTYNINTYNAGDVRPGMAVLDAAQVRQIAALMFLGNPSNSGPFSDAAIQLAIWSAEYGGAFSDNADAGTQAQVSLALADTAFGGIFDRGDLTLTVLTDAPVVKSQAFGVVTVATAVPEPATWAMMLLGFIGMGTLAMRKRREGRNFRLA